MLRWVNADVVGPYGVVKTTHWAVPPGSSVTTEAHTDSAEHAAQPRDALSDSDEATTRTVVQLEPAEDQLGAVLWNSNTAALHYLHTHLLGSTHARVPHAASRPLTGVTVVELGAGVGCLGIALAMGGARVVVTDIKELVPLMQHNINQNIHVHGGGGSGEEDRRGRCTALEWRWGPSVSLSVKKALKKKNQTKLHNSASVTTQEQTAGSSSSSTARICSSAQVHNKDDEVDDSTAHVAQALVRAALAPSQSWRACQAALGGSAVDCVVMCDALYGNPHDWPALLYTLTEILYAYPDVCKIVNFCEQRVNDVEGSFLALLDCENAATVDEEEMSDDVSAAALMTRALRIQRGCYRWWYRTEVLSGVQSDLNMVIHVTQIGWTRSGMDSDGDKARRATSELDNGAVRRSAHSPLYAKAARRPEREDAELRGEERGATRKKRHRFETESGVAAHRV